MWGVLIADSRPPIEGVSVDAPLPVRAAIEKSARYRMKQRAELLLVSAGIALFR